MEHFVTQFFLFLSLLTFILGIIFLLFQQRQKFEINQRDLYQKSHDLITSSEYDRQKAMTTKKELEKLQKDPQYQRLLKQLQRNEIPRQKDLIYEKIVLSDDDEFSEKKIQ